MTAPSDEQPSPASLRAFAPVALFDLLCMVGVSIEWVATGLAELTLFVVLVVARVPVWGAWLWSMLGPVRAWTQRTADRRRERELDDEFVAATDDAVLRLPRRFAVGYASLWVVQGLAVLAAGASTGLEWLAGLGFVIGVAVPTSVVVTMLVDHALMPVRREISGEVVRAGLVGRRAPSSLGARVSAFFMSFVTALVATLASLSLVWAGEDGLAWFAISVSVGVVAIPATYVVAQLLTRALIGPLDELGAVAAEFVERGELATLARLVPVQNDEVGRAAVQFNAMLDMLEQLTRAAEAVAAGELEVSLDHVGDLPAAFRAMVARLSETVVELRETAVELASVAAEIHGLMRSQAEAAHEQTATVTQVGGSVSALSDAAENIAERAKKVLGDAERAVAVTSDTSEQVAALRAQTVSIAELVEQIAAIADRSDILALNGSLEAVRAGEVGRGFALVAAEMRRLAEQVGGTLADVRAQIEAIDAAGAGTVEAIKGSRAIAERTAIAAAAISEVTQQQSEETRQAWSRMEQVMAMVERSTVAIGDTQQAASSLRSQAERLEVLLDGFRVQGGGSGGRGGGTAA